MNKQMAVATAALTVLILLFCSVSAISDDTDAEPIGDADSLKTEINNIVEQAKTQTSTTTYTITLVDNAEITVDSLLFDFTGVSSAVNINFEMGSKDSGATLNITGSES